MVDKTMGKNRTDNRSRSDRAKTTDSAKVAKQVQGNSRTSQADVPLHSLEDAERLSLALWENFAGKSASPPDLALSLGISPTSSSWRTLTGSAIAYGLTSGGWNASEISLTPLGRAIAGPTHEGEDLAARKEAALRPRVMREFFDRYDRGRLPGDAIGGNVLVSMGVPKDRSAAAFKVLAKNGRYAGIVLDDARGGLVHLNSRSASKQGALPALRTTVAEETALPRSTPVVEPVGHHEPINQERSDRVFVSAGLSETAAGHVHELLTFGRYVTATQTGESLSDAILTLASCWAALINVKSAPGSTTPTSDSLMLAGAAIAVLRGRVILLVGPDIDLPTELRALPYVVCSQSGDFEHVKLMKLVQAWSPKA